MHTGLFLDLAGPKKRGLGPQIHVDGQKFISNKSAAFDNHDGYIQDRYTLIHTTDKIEIWVFVYQFKLFDKIIHYLTIYTIANLVSKEDVLLVRALIKIKHVCRESQTILLTISPLK